MLIPKQKISKNDHEFGSEFWTFYLPILTAITILNMHPTLFRSASIVIRIWMFAIFIELVLFAIIIESVTSLFTMTGLKLKIRWTVRVLSIMWSIYYYNVAIRKERRAQRRFVRQHLIWRRQPEAFNNNIEQNRELY